jgi:NCAIR mutase (PurE)-related protein
MSRLLLGHAEPVDPENSDMRDGDIMDKADMLKLFAAIRDKEITPEQAVAKLQTAPFEDLGYAKVDHHRAIRQGVGEVIYGRGKTDEQILGITRALVSGGARNILVTRIGPDTAARLAEQFDSEYSETAELAVVARDRERQLLGCVAVVSAGTSDMPVAEEAALTAEALGSRVIRIYDAGVAGIHRLLKHADELIAARAIVAVAGMEGALPSVVGGLVSCPVIAVPTSVGYGASFGGVTALLAMINSCSSGVSVVNIDNGFGGGYNAHIINTGGALS